MRARSVRVLLLLMVMLVGMGGGAVTLSSLVPAQATAPEVVRPTPRVTPVATTTPRPRTSAPAPTTSPGERVIYLTFDDGPDPQWTPQVLRLLSKYDAQATFFVLGQSAAAHPGLVSQVRRQGSTVASHSWDHPDLTRLDAEGIRDQLRRTSHAIGGQVRCFRPPYGATNATVQAAGEGLGMRSVLWDVDTNDWRRPGAAVIEERVVTGARPGANVLLHDSGGDRSQTVSALEGMLRRLTAQGYTFRAVPGC